MSAVRTLATMRSGERGRVARVDVSPEVSRWLGALGIAPGTALTLLRRGLWGGPLHLRSDAGAEFAIASSLAAEVVLADESAP